MIAKYFRSMSIQGAIIFWLLLGLPLIWLLTFAAAAWNLYGGINELSDAQMLQIASRLVNVPVDPAMFARDEREDFALDDNTLESIASLDARSMTFAVWDDKGRLILSDSKSYFSYYKPDQPGFSNVNIKNVMRDKARLGKNKLKAHGPAAEGALLAAAGGNGGNAGGAGHAFKQLSEDLKNLEARDGKTDTDAPDKDKKKDKDKDKRKKDKDKHKHKDEDEDEDKDNHKKEKHKKDKDKEGKRNHDDWGGRRNWAPGGAYAWRGVEGFGVEDFLLRDKEDFFRRNAKIEAPQPRFGAWPPKSWVRIIVADGQNGEKRVAIVTDEPGRGRARRSYEALNLDLTRSRSETNPAQLGYYDENLKDYFDSAIKEYSDFANEITHGGADDDRLPRMMCDDAPPPDPFSSGKWMGKKTVFFNYGDKDDWINRKLLHSQHDWRILYVPNARSGFSVAVAQRMGARRQVVRETIFRQMLPVLIGLPLLIAVIIISVRGGLHSLKVLTATLSRRSPNDSTPISMTAPSEIKPVVGALNNLFLRVQDAITREHRFTQDAAHELRSPLAGLSIQVEAIKLADNDEDRLHAVGQMQESVERATHLIEQLLILAKVDPLKGMAFDHPVDWMEVSSGALKTVNIHAREKRIRLKREKDCDAPLPILGDETLLGLMLRNLLDNAIRYSPEGTTVTLVLRGDSVSVRDEGPGVKPEDMERIKNRFYRPPGQKENGSGLGLSIVEEIAALHGLRVDMRNLDPRGLEIAIRSDPDSDKNKEPAPDKGKRKKGKSKGNRKDASPERPEAENAAQSDAATKAERPSAQGKGAAQANEAGEPKPGESAETSDNRDETGAGDGRSHPSGERGEPGA